MIQKNRLLTIFLILISFTFIIGQVSAETLEVAHYTFNETSGTTLEDISGNDYDGTNNGATVNQTGKINKAYDFDGSNDYIELGNETFSSLGSTGSITGWFYYTDDTITNVLFNYYGSGIHDFLIPILSNNKLYVQLYNTDGFTTNINSDTAILSKNNWNHFVYTSDSTGSNIYINGDLAKNSENIALFNIGSTGNFRIGSKLANSDYFKGKLDDFRIYDFALSSNQVSLIYNSGNGTETPLDELRVTNSLTNPTAPLYIFNSYDWNLGYQDSDYNSDYSYKYSFGIDSDGNIETGTPIYWDTNLTLSVSDENLNYYTLDHDTNSSTYDDYYSFVTIHRFIDSTYEDSETIYSSETLDIIKNLDVNLEDPGTNIYTYKDYEWDLNIIENSYNSNKTYKYDFGINTTKTLSGATKYRSLTSLDIDSTSLEQFTIEQDINTDFLGDSYYSFVTLYTYDNGVLIDTNTTWTDDTFTPVYNLELDMNRPEYPDFANRLYVNRLFDWNLDVQDYAYDSLKTYEYDIGFNYTNDLNGSEEYYATSQSLVLSGTSEERFILTGVIPETFFDSNIYAFTTIRTYDNGVLIDTNTTWTEQFYVGSGLVRLQTYDEITGDKLDGNVIIYNTTVSKYFYSDENGLFEKNVYEEGISGFQEATIYREVDGEITHPARKLDIVFSNQGSFDGNMYLLDDVNGTNITYTVKDPEDNSWANKYFFFKTTDGSNVNVEEDELISSYSVSATSSGFEGILFTPNSDIYLTNIIYQLDASSPATRLRIYDSNTGLEIYESSITAGSTNKGIPLETLILYEDVNYSIVFDGNGSSYKEQKKLNHFSSGDYNLTNITYLGGCDDSYTVCDSENAFNLIGLESVDKTKYDTAKEEPYILLTKINSNGEFTGYVKEDANYTAFLVDSQGNLAHIYYKVSINVQKPKDEESLDLISPYDVTVGGLLEQSYTNQTGDDVFFSIFGGTNETYDFTVVDYNSDPVDRKYIPRTYSVKIPFGSDYVSSYDLPVYLISEEEGVIPSILVYDELKKPYEGLQVSIFRKIDGSQQLVEQKTTDSTGRTSFSAYPLKIYYIYIYEDEVLRGSYYIETRDSDETFYFIVDRTIQTDFTYKGLDIAYSWNDTVNNIRNTEDLDINFSATASNYTSFNFISYNLYAYQDSNLIHSTAGTLSGTSININRTIASLPFDAGYPIKVQLKLTFNYNGSIKYVYYEKTIGIRTSAINKFEILHSVPENLGRLWAVLMSILISIITMVVVGASDFINKDYLVFVGLFVLGIFVYTGWFAAGVELFGLDILVFIYVIAVVAMLGFAIQGSKR